VGSGRPSCLGISLGSKAMETSRFIGEPIRVVFEREPLLSKKPECPCQFEWKGQKFQILEVLAEWHVYPQRGAGEANRENPTSGKSIQRGSWGVGKTFFRVRTATGRVFVLYYDRAPRDADDRSGTWLLREEVLNPSSE
jgi:hypothetical protein